VSGSIDRTRGFSGLLKELVHDSTDLLRGEVLVARLELTDVAMNLARGTTAVALGAVLLLLGGLSLVAGLILVVGDQWLPRDRYWLAALVVMVITGGLAAWLARRGLAQLSPSQLTPDQTLETLKEDKEWLKRQLTSGAT
jgi:uncharacterized membrane protein YqjE